VAGRHIWAGAVCAVGLLIGGAPPQALPQTAVGPLRPLVPPCDQFNPFSPARSTRITLDSGDLVQRQGRELRSFIDTGSLGRADIAIVSAAPQGSVLAVSAIPEISRISPYFGERLKGVALDVAVRAPGQPIRVVLALRQVCARYFRNTFLYY